ncbi:MAG: FCD domain-containing protein [Nocardioides sp.]|uniref:FadR/GntR family transcriptional regulator n=1 Tax=Nocardioides sp. TaxID=35761 RepID=UPI0039E2C059
MLWRSVVSGEWPVGSRIPTINQLMRETGQGLQTVRETVGTMVNLGMLETLGGRGTVVREVSPARFLFGAYVDAGRVEEVHAFVRALEVEAARRAAERRSDADADRIIRAGVEIAGLAEAGARLRRDAHQSFLDLVFAAAGSPLLAEWHRGARTSLENLGGGSASDVDSSEVSGCPEIAEAIARRDPDAAALNAARRGSRCSGTASVASLVRDERYNS